MAADEQSGMRKLVWNDLFPWLKLVRVFRIAISFRALVLAAAALFLTMAGWWMLDRVFAKSGMPSPWAGVSSGCPWLDAANQLVPDAPGGLALAAPQTAMKGSWPSGNPIGHAWLQLSAPLARGFGSSGIPFSYFVCYVLSGLWGLAVWAFAGTAICRTAAVQLAAGERASLGSVVKFASRKWLSAFSAPIFPLLGVTLAVIPVAILGIFLRVLGGSLLVGIFWPLALAAGMLMATLLLGLVFGWPLMWSTISTEGTDSFDAISRSYAYVFQRPLHLLFYTAVAALLGSLGWWLVANFTAAVVALTYWAASWGAGAANVAVVQSDAATGGLTSAGAHLIQFWNQCIKLLAVGFLYSYFWTASTAIYLLLRRDVDATEMDEVFLEDADDAAPLPTIKTDASGAPVAGDAPANPAS